MWVFLQHLFIDGFAFLTLVFTVLFFMGMVKQKPLYFQTLNFIMFLYIGGFLVYRFKIKPIEVLTSLDKKVCYLGGTYILWFSLANIITDYYNADLKKYVDDVVTFVKKD